MNLRKWIGECHPRKPAFLEDFSKFKHVNEEGFLFSDGSTGMMFLLEGIDGSCLSNEELSSLHHGWRSILRFLPGEELQIVFRKRVDFSEWVEMQLKQSFLSENRYGRRILLDRLLDQMNDMGQDGPKLLSQKIIACFWTSEALQEEELIEKRSLLRSQLGSFGFSVQILDKNAVREEMKHSAQTLTSSPHDEAEWPHLKIEAGQINIEGNQFRALELSKLPESFTEIGMIQSISRLPYPIDLSVRLRARDERPMVTRLQRKRNLLNAQRGSKDSPSPQNDSQIEQIDEILRSLADRSEAIFDMSVTVGLRLPKEQSSFLRKALASIRRLGAKLNFSEFEECTIGTFDSYLECIPGFQGKNIRQHIVLGSNAIHFLPFFRPFKGDKRPIITFQGRNASLCSIDPVDPHLANYNWLVSGTSGAGKSFFVNSLLAQSASINPNIFIVDIGGSYNKLSHFLGGKVMSLEPGHGFELSPFFLPKSSDAKEERMRRQHVHQIFLEMIRIDGELPSIELRHLLSEILREVFEMDSIPERPITYLVDQLSKNPGREARRLSLLLQPWSYRNGFFGQYLDNNRIVALDDPVLAFDLKGLTEFEDLSRVVQLIVCASLWARIRQSDNQKFSWIVLDEVAFSLLKTQPEFVDELVSTLRKYFAGAVIVVQDMEKVTSNFAGSSILQNTQSKALLQQRGDPRNYADALSLNQVDEWAIESLNREKGRFSEVFLMRDRNKTVIRHVPSPLEYWLGTTAPEDTRELKNAMSTSSENYQKQIIDFVSHKRSQMKLSLLVLFIFSSLSAFLPAQSSILPSETLQLQKLIAVSEQQLKAVGELLAHSQRDSASLEKASKILGELASGINQSIEKYQGSKAYEMALLQFQLEGLEEKSSDLEQATQKQSKKSERFMKFQNESVQANLSDLDQQKKLEAALRSTDPGFIPKLQTQAQIGSWQASTRVSTQISELLAIIEDLRSEIRSTNHGAFATIVQGSELQNDRQRKGRSRDSRQ